MTDVGARLLHFIETEKISVRQFENMLKLGNGFVRGTNERMRLVTRDKIQQAFPHLNMKWVLTGEGNMIKQIEQTPEEKVEHSTIYDTLVETMKKLLEQNSSNAEANRINAEANRLNAEVNKKNADSIERLITLITELSNGNLPIK